MAGRYGKCLTRGPERPMETTGIMILLRPSWFSPGPHYHHTSPVARAVVLNPRRITGIYFLACPGAGSCFLPRGYKVWWSWRGRACWWNRQDAAPDRGTAARLNIDEGPGAREPNARLLRARWSNLRGRGRRRFFPPSQALPRPCPIVRDERNWLAT